MSDRFNLEGKVAIVTGGNGGIGKGIARGLAAAGSDIVIVARDQEKTDAAASEIQADFGVRLLGLQRDLREESQIQDTIEPVVREFGQIDILVNNAGINIRKMPQEYAAAEWDQILDTNLRSPFLCSQAVYPVMK